MLHRYWSLAPRLGYGLWTKVSSRYLNIAVNSGSWRYSQYGYQQRRKDSSLASTASQEESKAEKELKDSLQTKPAEAFVPKQEPLSFALPLSGGVGFLQERNELHTLVEKRLAKLALKKHEVVDPLDVTFLSKDVCLVGVGISTTFDGFSAALKQGVFDPATRVLCVRDIFDRSENRRTLSNYLATPTDDAVAMLRTTLRFPHQRLVNEYVRVGTYGTPNTNSAQVLSDSSQPNEESSTEELSHGPFGLRRHDVNFVEWLHEEGYRVLPCDSKEQMEKLVQAGTLPIQQSTNHVLMVAPTAFTSNADAAVDNHFMDRQTENLFANSLRQQVLKEYNALYTRLTTRGSTSNTGAGVRAHLFTHSDHHGTPDAVFPNNWFSTHTDLEVGQCTLVLYPMKPTNRRKERRPEFINRLHAFQRYTHVVDLTRSERVNPPRFLEGTGSLVLDRVNRIAYAVLSERTDKWLTQSWARTLGYTPVMFHALDTRQRPIYHTNVMMCVGTRFAVVCEESIADPKEREMVLGSLRATNHAIVSISQAQMEQFCGNVLELENFYGEQILAMSTRALNAFTKDQLDIIQASVSDIVHADIGTLERVGGGGTRCMIAELF